MEHSSHIQFSLDGRVYGLTAVKKAAYRFGDRCFVQIEVLAHGGIQVKLTAKSERVPLDTLEGEFRNELLDQDLRESIAAETGRIRNLILAQAFSGLSLTDKVADAADHRDDPLGIGESQAAKH